MPFYKNSELWFSVFSACVLRGIFTSVMEYMLVRLDRALDILVCKPSYIKCRVHLGDISGCALQCCSAVHMNLEKGAFVSRGLSDFTLHLRRFDTALGLLPSTQQQRLAAPQLSSTVVGLL